MPKTSPAAERTPSQAQPGVGPLPALMTPPGPRSLEPMRAPPPLAPLAPLHMGGAMDVGHSPGSAGPVLASAAPTALHAPAASLQVHGAAALSQDHGPTPYVSQVVYDTTPRAEAPSIFAKPAVEARGPRTAQEIAHDTPFAFRHEPRAPAPPRSSTPAAAPPKPQAPAPVATRPPSPPTTPPSRPPTVARAGPEPQPTPSSSAPRAAPSREVSRPAPPPRPQPPAPPKPPAKDAWPAGLVLEPVPTQSRPGTKPLEAPPPRPPPPRAPHHSPRLPSSSDDKSGMGKGILVLLAIGVMALKTCEGRSNRRTSSPSPDRPGISFPQRNTQPLNAAERRRLEQLRRDHLNGETMTADERKELLDLERRARAGNPGGR